MDPFEKLAELRAQRAAELENMRAIHDRAQAEHRDLTRAESEAYARMERRFDVLNGEVEQAQREAEASDIRTVALRLADARDAGNGGEQADTLRSVALGVQDARGFGESPDGPGSALAAALGIEGRAIGGGAGIGAALTPAGQWNAVLAGLRAKSVFLASGPVVISTDSDSLNLPHETGSTASLADWVSEGAAITPADPGGETLTAVPRKVAALATLSNEVVQDSDPTILGHFQERLLYSLALRADAGFFEGSGTAPQIKGLKNVAGIQSVSMGTNGAAPTNLDPWADAIGGVIEKDGDESRIAVFMHGRTWRELLKLKETGSSSKPLLVEQTTGPTGEIRRSIYGRPVYITSQLSTTETQGSSGAVASSSYVVDTSRVLVVVRDNGRFEADRSVLFGSDQTQVRAVARVDLVVPDPLAVSRIVGIL